MSRKRNREDENEDEDDEYFDDARVARIVNRLLKSQELNTLKKDEMEAEMKKNMRENSKLRPLLDVLPFGWGKQDLKDQLISIIGSIVLDEYTETNIPCPGMKDGPKNINKLEFYIPYYMHIDLKMFNLLGKLAVYYELKKGRKNGEMCLEVHLTEDKMSLIQYSERQVDYKRKEPVDLAKHEFSSDFLRRFLKAVTSNLDIVTDPRFQPMKSFTNNHDELCIQTVLVKPPITKYDINGGLDKYSMFYDFKIQAEEETNELLLHLTIIADEKIGSKNKD